MRAEDYLLYVILQKNAASRYLRIVLLNLSVQQRIGQKVKLAFKIALRYYNHAEFQIKRNESVREDCWRVLAEQQETLFLATCARPDSLLRKALPT